MIQVIVPVYNSSYNTGLEQTITEIQANIHKMNKNQTKKYFLN